MVVEPARARKAPAGGFQVHPPTFQAARPPSTFWPVALMVDDHPSIAELVRDVLEEDQWRVVSAADGQEALALANEWVPDLVLTDVQMPRLDGFGLIRALRRLYPTVPVIVMTGDEFYAGRPTEAVAAEVGALTTVLKPFDLDDLRKTIRSVTSSWAPHLAS